MEPYRYVNLMQKPSTKDLESRGRIQRTEK